MKTAIIFKSVTGNTKRIAQSIREALQSEEIVYFGEPQPKIEADLYIVGSWTDKGMCAKEILSFLEGLKDRKIAYFGTAGFGGSPDYYRTLYQRIQESVDGSNQLLGGFYCQGKMPLGVRNRYVQILQAHPDDKKLQASLENFDQALQHPNEQDCQNAKAWIRGIVNALSKAE